MDWQSRETLPRNTKRQIIIATREEKSQQFVYNVVFYYDPMKDWYGGPGIRVKDEDIEWWADIPPPK
jgi:hypothetical protein